MESKIFLSHDHQDDELAQVLAQVLSRITLLQLEVWFSSDGSAIGGIRPGNLWIEEIRTQLKQSKAIIVLITPTSLSRPWLLFESGFGAAIPDCDVIPLCIGMSTGEVPFPLAMYQCYQLADYDSLKTFISKLLERYKINFDEEMASPVLKRAISDFTRLTQTTGKDKSTPHQPTLADLSLDIKQHIDRRIIELVERPQISTQKKSIRSQDSNNLSYTVPISIKFSAFESEQYLEIGTKTTVQDILDNVYFMIEPYVEPYTYLQSWIIRETNRDINLIVREVAGLIPATSIFTPSTEWEAMELQMPYEPSNSTDFNRWYGTPWR